VQKHINDSLSLLPPIDTLAAGICDQNVKIIDVGSGAGFPGVVLAIARPHWQVQYCTLNFYFKLDTIQVLLEICFRAEIWHNLVSVLVGGR
jgi:hypothetical protein